MGCSQSRDKNEEDLIEDFERRLQFPSYSIGEIKQAFSHASGAGSISKAQIDKFLKNLKIEYTWNDKTEVFDPFLANFEIGGDTYDLTDILATLFVMSKSTVPEKAIALFDLHDTQCSGLLSKEEADVAFHRICELVCKYSESFLEQDEEEREMHEAIFNRKREEMVPKLIDFFFEEKGKLTYEKFKVSLINACSHPLLLDITSPKSIRRALMEYVFGRHKTKLELQQIYKIRKSKSKYAFQENGESKQNSGSNTPQMSPRGTSNTTLDSKNRSKNNILASPF